VLGIATTHPGSPLEPRFFSKTAIAAFQSSSRPNCITDPLDLPGHQVAPISSIEDNGRWSALQTLTFGEGRHYVWQNDSPIHAQSDR
jgi:hypothetical protein